LKKNKRKAIRGTNPGRCPYCGSHVILRSADGIYKDNSGNAMLYVCSRYPTCDAYVRPQRIRRAEANSRPMPICLYAMKFSARLHT
jgi:ssDNA-binding Zn-finger/Zn-ribbon topoisomerase 1